MQWSTTSLDYGLMPHVHVESKTLTNQLHKLLIHVYTISDLHTRYGGYGVPIYE